MEAAPSCLREDSGGGWSSNLGVAADNACVSVQQPVPFRLVRPPVASPVVVVAGAAPAALPGRSLLVGTERTLRELRHTLELADPSPLIVGSITLEPGVSVDWPAVVREHEASCVLVCLPSAVSAWGREIAASLEHTGAVVRHLPTLSDQLAGRASALRSQLEVDPAALIDRVARPADPASLRHLLTGERVLITGAGGSIGSELARIVAGYNPAQLILVERGENALFEVHRRLKAEHPALQIHAVLHDVTAAQRTLDLLAQHRPDVVLHAAAHKHVGVMEDHPADAVENNFYGTRSIADAADRAGTKRFVMISTDKAVNPSSIMGATKRLAELYIQSLNQLSRTRYCMVRFGNVLGSACSVLPIWSDQLRHGGPLTVTDPRMTRYFMTIPEAADLVLQAAAFEPPSPTHLTHADAERREASGDLTQPTAPAEVFLLDMGKPQRILDLAERFIRAHGLEPHADIPLRITGARPGEKLFEELAYDGEDMLPTPHPAIRRWRTTPPTLAFMQQTLATFDRLRGKSDQPWRDTAPDAVVLAIRAAVPEMVESAAG